MTEKPIVDIAIACNKVHHPEWSSAMMGLIAHEVMSGVTINRVMASISALPDQGKNSLVAAWANQKKRQELTDMNRNAIVGLRIGGETIPRGFMDSEAEWIMWLDDDTVPPRGFLSHLLSLKRPFVGGVYFLGSEPYNPVAYMRDKNGFYHALEDYPHGALIPVDSIGMGCTLIHKEVYQKIVESYTLFQRPDGTLVPVLKENIIDDPYFNWDSKEPKLVNGRYLITPVTTQLNEDLRPWPFYAMEYSRTEDHYFCELARAVGYRPYLDTRVVCDHLKLKPINLMSHLEYKERYGRS